MLRQLRVLGVEAGEFVRVKLLRSGRARGVMRSFVVRARARSRGLGASGIAGCGTCLEEDLTGGAWTTIICVGLRIKRPPPGLDVVGG
eukprot:3873501-Heterocapsa_arctica.AAC.1